MRILISPAKKMVTDVDTLAPAGLPALLHKTEVLYKTLRDMPYESLKALWKCNDGIAQQNMQRLLEMDLSHHLTPALLSYEGIQYRYMAPRVFTEQETAYAQEHLRILSGFYGVLRPLDGVTPYRLEMQARLKVNGAKDLYAYWGDTIAQTILKETDTIINLASKEYSVAVSKYLPEGVTFLTCVFGEEKEGKVLEKGTMCKMARGEMVRFLAENQITDPENIKAFDRLRYAFDITRSNEHTYVFLRNA